MSQHVSVMPEEILAWLAPQPGQTFVDGTLGGGGHTRLLAEAVGDAGQIIALDRDAAALERAETSLKGLPIKIAQSNFCDLPEVLAEIGIPQVNGIVLDLGLSSDQLADRERGFSFDSTGPLDLRFDTSQGQPASWFVNKLRAEDLADLIFQFGEERYSRRIARVIEERRRTQPIETASELADLVRRVVPKSGHIDSATRTFQALRIAVNEELKSLEIALKRFPDCLLPGGRLAILSFHSLEDVRVKEAFRDDARYEVLTKKPIPPSDKEVQQNPRSRSAKLRVAARAV